MINRPPPLNTPPHRFLGLPQDRACFALRAGGELDLDVKFRAFPSGVLALQSAEHDVAAIIDHLLALLDAEGSLSALGVVDGLMQRAGMKLPYELAAEYLELAEQDGALCRDESIAGTRYYANRFAEFAR